MGKLLALLATATVLAAGCRDPGSPALGGAAETVALPEVAHVVCTETGTEVLTPRVLTRPDGVHFRVENRTAEQTTYLAILQGDAVPAPPGQTEGVSAVPPGTVRLACATGTSYPEESSFPSLEVVDEGGHWVPEVVECEGDTAQSWVIDYIMGARGDRGDPVDIAREKVDGIRESDAVERAGYVRGPEGKVRVLRDDRVVALLRYSDDGEGGWLLSIATACEGSGIG